MPALPWDASPPRNFLEEWAYGRRNNAVQVATAVLGSLVMARAKASDSAYEQPDEDERRALADEAASITLRLVERVEAAFPRPEVT